MCTVVVSSIFNFDLVICIHYVSAFGFKGSGMTSVQYIAIKYIAIQQDSKNSLSILEVPFTLIFRA